MYRLASLASIFVLACSTSAATTTPAEYDDTAQQIGATITTGIGGGDTGSIADVMTLASGRPLPGFAASGQVSAQVSGKYDGVIYTYELTCQDTGTTLAPCGATTDRSTADVSSEGTLVLADLRASVTRGGTWQLAGLQSSTATLDGSADMKMLATVDSIFRPVTASYDLAALIGYDGVVIDVATKQPIGGTISYDVTAAATDPATHTSEASFTIDAELAFAPGLATLVLDDQYTYTLDTRTGTISRGTRIETSR